MNQCEMGCTVYMAVGRLLNRMHSIAWLDSRRVLCIVLLVEKPPRKFSNGLPSTFYERRPHFTSTFQAKFQEAVKFHMLWHWKLEFLIHAMNSSLRKLYNVQHDFNRCVKHFQFFVWQLYLRLLDKWLFLSSDLNLVLPLITCCQLHITYLISFRRELHFLTIWSRTLTKLSFTKNYIWTLLWGGCLLFTFS